MCFNYFNHSTDFLCLTLFLTGRSNYETHPLSIPLALNQNSRPQKARATSKRVTTRTTLGPARKSVQLSDISPKSCGVVKRSSAFVLGGTLKDSDKWPWIAAVYVGDDYVCSATFITRTRAVTAAHCFKKSKVDDVQLYSYADKCEYLVHIR